MQERDSVIDKISATLPEPPEPLGNYVGAITVGDLVFVSGHGTAKPDGSYILGKVPTDCSETEAYKAARLVGINILATLKAHLGDLKQIKKVVKIFGMVNAEPSFANHPSIINGCSDLMVEVFGESGRAARSAVGVSSLPMNIPVEIEVIVQIQ